MRWSSRLSNMTPQSLRADRIALLVGMGGLCLFLGALGFQYIGGYPPCEMCHWQRWPHIAGATIGIVGGLLVASGRLDRRLAPPVAILAIVLIATSGAIGFYHAGVEWKWWQGPSACTASFVPGQAIDLTNIRVPMCDRAAWRLFGISMAGYNAM